MERYEVTAYEHRYRAAYAAGLPAISPHRLPADVWDVLRTIRGRSAVADLGCGEGYLTVQLALAGFDVTGYDASPTAIGHARRVNSRAGVRYRVRDILREGLPGHNAALVTDFGCLHHILSEPLRLRYLKNVAQALAEGGTYYVRAGLPLREAGRPKQTGLVSFQVGSIIGQIPAPPPLAELSHQEYAAQISAVPGLSVTNVSIRNDGHLYPSEVAIVARKPIVARKHGEARARPCPEAAAPEQARD